MSPGRCNSAAQAMKCFFFKAPATTQIYTLSLHDALPIYADADVVGLVVADELLAVERVELGDGRDHAPDARSEEHTSELQSHVNLVCRLLLEKKNATPSAGRIRAERRTRMSYVLVVCARD